MNGTGEMVAAGHVRRDFLLPEPLMADGDGYLALPKGPGLGVELDWAGIEPLRVE